MHVYIRIYVCMCVYLDRSLFQRILKFQWISKNGMIQCSHNFTTLVLLFFKNFKAWSVKNLSWVKVVTIQEKKFCGPNITLNPKKLMQWILMKYSFSSQEQHYMQNLRDFFMVIITCSPNALLYISNPISWSGD